VAIQDSNGNFKVKKLNLKITFLNRLSFDFCHKSSGSNVLKLLELNKLENVFNYYWNQKLIFRKFIDE
jgi:hypothetical protein